MQKRKLLDLVNLKFQKKMYSTARADYLEAEANLGSQIFGPVPPGVERMFFHSTQKNVWIWHENGITIRYEVRPHGVFKRINSAPFTRLEGQELANFRAATKNYLAIVKSQLYRK